MSRRLKGITDKSLYAQQKIDLHSAANDPFELRHLNGTLTWLYLLLIDNEIGSFRLLRQVGLTSIPMLGPTPEALLPLSILLLLLSNPFPNRRDKLCPDGITTIPSAPRPAGLCGKRRTHVAN